MRKVGKLLVMIALFSLVFGSVAFAQKKEGEWVIAYIAKNTVDAFHATLNGAATS